MVPAIIPVNRLDRSKGRLEQLLSPAERRQLTLATLQTVVEAVTQAGLEAVVLTADSEVEAAVWGHATVIGESEEATGLNGQLEVALTGRTEVLILHADLPLATPEAVAEVCLPVTPPSVSLVRSTDGGTNAMLLRPAGLFAVAYGPGSFARHVDAARAAGMGVRVVESPALRLDLDTPDDVAAFMATGGWEKTAAGQLLAAWGVGDRRG